DKGIAGSWIARRPWPSPEFLWHFNRLHAGAAEFAVLQFVPFSRGEFERAFAAVQFHVIEAAPAFVSAAGQFRAFQDARCPILKFADNCHPILSVIWMAVAHGGEILYVCDEPFHWANQMVGK